MKLPQLLIGEKVLKEKPFKSSRISIKNVYYRPNYEPENTELNACTSTEMVENDEFDINFLSIFEKSPVESNVVFGETRFIKP